MALLKKTGEVYWKLEKKGLSLIWRNFAGGYHDFTPVDLECFPIIGSVEAERLQRLQMAGRVLSDVLDRNLHSGWISPEGKFYSCHFSRHLDLLEGALQHDPYKSEVSGWLKITQYTWQKIIEYKTITPQQKKMLELIGRSTEDMNYRDSKLTYKAAFPKGNSAMDKLYSQYEEILKEEEEKLQPIKINADQVGLYL